MFTGIVTAVGSITEASRHGDGVTLTIAAPYDDLTLGESIAVSGVCLTVTSRGAGWFTVQAVTTTRERTNVGSLTAGDRVNLERALAAGDRMGGHFVQGHVDGTAEVVAVREDGEGSIIELRLPEEVTALTVPRGSITVDGVSLTISDLTVAGTVRIALIPFTRSNTTLGDLKVGDRVNVEGDVLGKYVQRLMGR